MLHNHWGRIKSYSEQEPTTAKHHFPNCPTDATHRRNTRPLNRLQSQLHSSTSTGSDAARTDYDKVKKLPGSLVGFDDLGNGEIVSGGGAELTQAEKF
jgi:hypothetical protein